MADVINLERWNELWDWETAHVYFPLFFFFFQHSSLHSINITALLSRFLCLKAEENSYVILCLFLLIKQMSLVCMRSLSVCLLLLTGLLGTSGKNESGLAVLVQFSLDQLSSWGTDAVESCAHFWVWTLNTLSTWQGFLIALIKLGACTFYQMYSYILRYCCRKDVLRNDLYMLWSSSLKILFQRKENSLVL